MGQNTDASFEGIKEASSERQTYEEAIKNVENLTASMKQRLAKEKKLEPEIVEFLQEFIKITEETISIFRELQQMSLKKEKDEQPN